MRKTCFFIVEKWSGVCVSVVKYSKGYVLVKG